jgi:hypothetical protein
MLVEGVEEMIVLSAEAASEHHERQLNGAERLQRVGQVDIAVDCTELVAGGSLGDEQRAAWGSPSIGSPNWSSTL